ncbi:MAG: hypothetical protein Q9159_000120 [Coniocarpon cinnabarinum]
MSSTAAHADIPEMLDHAAIPPSTESIHKNLQTSKSDDPFAVLSAFDTVLLVDDSSRMSGPLWKKTAKAIEAIAPICVHHAQDGIGLCFLNACEHNDMHVNSVAHIKEVLEDIQPHGRTPTDRRLGRLLKQYLDRLKAARSAPESVKPLNIIVITAGRPSDEKELEWELEKAAKRLDNMRIFDGEPAPAHQVGVQFFQIGNASGAKRHLKYLDDELHRRTGCRDIVDTVPSRWFRRYNRALILKTVLGGVVKEYDAQTVGMSGSVS